MRKFISWASNQFKFSQIQQVICQALSETGRGEGRGRSGRWWLGVDEETLFRHAQANQVAPMLAHGRMALAPPEEVRAPWRQAHDEVFQRNTVYLAELDRIAQMLWQTKIALVALKNGGIARGIYPCVGCCPMGDLDVMVERPHFRRAHRLLLEDGYWFEFRSPFEEAELEAAERNGGAEYWKILPGGEKLWLELQWRPVAGRWLRPDQEPSAGELLARSQPIAGTRVRLLSPEDNLLQVSLHTAKHSYVRAPGFRLHLDVDRIVRRCALDWDLFLKMVLRLEVKTPVYFSLALPQALFGTPIPQAVLARLRPRAWKEQLIGNWLQRVGLFNPDDRKFSNLGYIVFCALLYDDLRGLWRALFPEKTWIQDRYGVSSRWPVPVHYASRLWDLAFKRR